MISREPIVLVGQLAVPMHPVLQYPVLAPVAHNAPLEHAELDLPRARWVVGHDGGDNGWSYWLVMMVGHDGRSPGRVTDPVVE